MNTFANNPEHRYSNLGTLDDVRDPRGNTTSEAQEDVMNSLLNIILTHKKEMQKVPHFSSVQSATAWLNKHPRSGLRVQEKDLDGDGTQEVVMYNRAGKPVVVNGYKLRASDYPQRRAYWAEHPEIEDRIGEPYGDWVRDKVYEVHDDPNNAWKRSVRLSTKGQQLKDWGYRVPTAPRKRDSPYSIFCKLVKNFVNDYLSSDDPADFKKSMGENVGDENVKFIKKIASPISMYRMMYLKLIERPYFFLLYEKGTVKTYKQFKEYQKTHKMAFYKWFEDNFLEGPRKEQLKMSKLPPAVLKGTFIKGQLNIDGSDPDDSIVFLLGLDNINDDQTHPMENSGGERAAYTFEDFILNNRAAEQFNEACSTKSDPSYKSAKKALEKFKKRAQASTKAYFAKEIERLFENPDALDTFRQAQNFGVPLAQNEEIAQQAAEEMQAQGMGPSSPLRAPTNAPADQQQTVDSTEQDD